MHMATVLVVLFILLNCTLLICQENQTSSGLYRPGGLFPGEELLNTFQKSAPNNSFNPDLNGVPKQLEVLKGWAYEDNSTEQETWSKQSTSIKRRKKRHLLKCFLGQCGGGHGNGGRRIFISIALPSIGPPTSLSCDTCGNPQSPQVVQIPVYQTAQNLKPSYNQPSSAIPPSLPPSLPVYDTCIYGNCVYQIALKPQPTYVQPQPSPPSQVYDACASGKCEYQTAQKPQQSYYQPPPAIPPPSPSVYDTCTYGNCVYQTVLKPQPSYIQPQPSIPSAPPPPPPTPPPSPKPVYNACADGSCNDSSPPCAVGNCGYQSSQKQTPSYNPPVREPCCDHQTAPKPSTSLPPQSAPPSPPQPAPPPPPQPLYGSTSEPCLSGGCVPVRQPAACPLCGSSHEVTYVHSEFTSYSGSWKKPS